MLLEKNALVCGEADISAIKQKLLSLPESDWHKNEFRQRTFSVHSQTQSIIIYFKRTAEDAAMEYPDLEKEWASLLQPIYDVFSEFYKYEDLVITKVLFARMKSGTRIPAHRDTGIMFRTNHRVHVPIKTDEKVDFVIDGEHVKLKEGVIYDINNLGLHSVTNNSHEDRIHLIFDVEKVQ